MAEISIVSAIPLMTSNTTSNGIASASSEFNTTYQAWKAFDGIDDSYGWASTSGSVFPQWLKYKFAEPKIICKYSIKSRNSVASDISQTLKDWEFQGSNDDSVWTTLDKRIEEIGWTATQKREYIFDNTKKYHYYRILITANNGSTLATAIGEMEMFELLFEKGKLALKNPPTNNYYSLSDNTLIHLPDGTNKHIIEHGIEQGKEIQLDVPFTKHNYVNALPIANVNGKVFTQDIGKINTLNIREVN